MASSRSDLLSITRTLVSVASVVAVLAICLSALILGALLLGDSPRINFSGTLSTLLPEERLFAARVAAAGVLVCSSLFVPMLRLMLCIVDSARAGDPFVPENGVRLRNIGWLMLAVNLVTGSTIAAALQGQLKFPPVSFATVLGVLMIFVIARIFETGSAMRDELKETV